MEPAVSLVIKANYKDEMKVFKVVVRRKELDRAMQEVKGKIVSLFRLDEAAAAGSHISLSLTYVDKEGDMVSLDSASDLLCAVEQRHSVLRVLVKNNTALKEEIKRKASLDRNDRYFQNAGAGLFITCGCFLILFALVCH